MQLERDEDFPFVSLSTTLLEEHPPTPTASILSPAPVPDPSFDFFVLPPEIRLQIFSCLLRKPGGAYIGSPSLTNHFTPESSVSNVQFFRDFRTHRNLSLALTCRQIHFETTQIFYGDNGFEFCEEGPLFKFLVSLTQISRKHIRRVRFVSLNFPRRSARCLLRSLILLRVTCTHLGSLELIYRELTGYSKANWDFHIKDLRNWLFRSPAYEGGPTEELRDVGITSSELSLEAFMSYRSS